MTQTRHSASFRDPSGFVFHGADGQLYRQINRCYEAEYRFLIDSKLYDRLVQAGLLIDHEELPLSDASTDQACCLLRPRRIPFISYPYEWSFSQLQAAALLTLQIQQRSLKSGMSLKDASSFNVQWLGSKPVFIDLLSFEKYEPGRPWSAYGQFCRHFLAPLALMARTDVRLNRLLALYLDGIPLDLAARLLPWRTRFRPGLAMHLHLHAWSVARHADTAAPLPAAAARPQLKETALHGLLDSLYRTIDGLAWTPRSSAWADYQTTHSYSREEHERKQRIVSDFLDRARPRTVWDLGANVGLFSRIASRKGAHVVAFDFDPACVEMNFVDCRKQGERNLLPLVLDLANPTPALGWGHQERQSLLERGPADLVMALALVHHLAIGNNVPFAMLADFLARAGHWLIVEFVPKIDPQVARLLRARADIFADYHENAFVNAMTGHFHLQDRQPLTQGGRVLYLFRGKNSSGERSV